MSRVGEKGKLWRLVPAIIAVTSCGGSGGATSGGSGGGPSGNVVWGVTIDDTSGADQIADSLRSLPVRPTARVVFDKDMAPGDYLDDLNTIRGAADVMGLIADSSDVKALTSEGYHDRAVQYFDALASQVAVWEVGNEVNGDWLGTPASVASKVVDAYDEAHKRGLKTAITLYYNTTCSSDPTAYMTAWVDTWLPDRVRNGVDYLLVSYYPDDCGGVPDWPTTFGKLRSRFPTAKLGFGEIGVNSSAKKAAFVRSFYRMPAPTTNFIGGYFYWTFKQDAVPKSKPLWSVFHDVIRP